MLDASTIAAQGRVSPDAHILGGASDCRNSSPSPARVRRCRPSGREQIDHTWRRASSPGIIGSMTEPRAVELYERYSDLGHRGARERRENFAFEVTGIAQDAVAVLVERHRIEKFPSDELVRESTTRWSIPAVLLVDFIKQHGARVP